MIMMKNKKIEEDVKDVDIAGEIFKDFNVNVLDDDEDNNKEKNVLMKYLETSHASQISANDIDEMKKIGKEINAPLVANMIEGGATPLSSAETLNKMGFKIILYPLSVLYANTFATMNILKELKKSGNTTKYKQKVVNFDQFNDLVELPKFRKIEKKFRFSKRE